MSGETVIGAGVVVSEYQQCFESWLIHFSIQLAADVPGKAVEVGPSLLAPGLLWEDTGDVTGFGLAQALAARHGLRFNQCVEDQPIDLSPFSLFLQLSFQ